MDRMSVFFDRCGLRLLVFLACFAVTGAGDPPPALHIIAASAAALAAAGALDAVVFRGKRFSLPRPKTTLREYVGSALRRGNAKRFIAVALILTVMALLLGSVWYAVFAVVNAALAVLCLARKI